jgi:hypothetical protein
MHLNWLPDEAPCPENREQDVTDAEPETIIQPHEPGPVLDHEFTFGSIITPTMAKNKHGIAIVERVLNPVHYLQLA